MASGKPIFQDTFLQKSSFRGLFADEHSEV